jgi:HK97 family phage major capsid protein
MKKKLHEELQRVMGQLTTLRDLAERTAEQETEIDTLSARATELMGKIARETELEEIASRVSASANALPAGGAPSAPNARGIVLPATAKRKAPKGFESAEQAFAFGQFARGVFTGNGQARQWLQDHGYALTRAQSEGDNTAGGYLVPTEFGQIIESLIPEYGIARRYCNVVPMARDTKSHPKTPALLLMRPAGELQTVTNDTIRFGNVELVARKWMLILQTSSELSEDAAIDLAGQVSQTCAKSAAYTEDMCLWRGDGTSTYNSVVGVFNALNNVASNLSVQTLTGADTYEEVTKAQLLGLVGGINEAATMFGDLAWFCTHKAKLELFYRIALEQGGSTANEIVSSPNPTFLGYPIVVSNAITNNETSGGFAFAFGSLRAGVMFGDRREYSLVNSLEAGFTTDSEYWRATERFDINVFEPGSATVAGPIMVGKFA